MRYFLKKLFMLAITLVLVSVIAFGIFQILPGDPIVTMLGVHANPEQVEILRHELGYDKPAIERYGDWISGLFRGDLGISLKYQKPVADILKARVEPTVMLAVGAIILTLLIGIPIGIALAVFNEKRITTFFTLICQIGTAIPCFWLGMMLIFIVSAILGLLPAGGFTFWHDDPVKCIKSLILPCTALAIGDAAVLIRYLKNGMLDQMDLDYVRTAFSKGATRNRVVYGHVLRNAMIPVLTVIGMMIAEILAGSIVVENVFAIPGLGALMIASITSRDLVLIQSLTMYIACIIVTVNTAIDLLYAAIDPRIRLK